MKESVETAPRWVARLLLATRLQNSWLARVWTWRSFIWIGFAFLGCGLAALVHGGSILVFAGAWFISSLLALYFAYAVPTRSRESRDDEGG